MAYANGCQFHWIACSAFAVLGMLLGLPCPANSASASADSPKVTYERHVRPIFKTHCFQCHGEDEEPEGGLDLRLRRLIMAGGESGEVIAPGKASDSLLVQRMMAGEMPPEEIKTRPSDAEIEIVKNWIALGAPTARPEPPELDPSQYFTEEELAFWSFRPIRKVVPPVVNQRDAVRNPIDQFVLAELEARGLSLSPSADQSTLIRRLSFDLLGLPPTPEAVAEFLADTRPNAFERLVDRLMASPRYGERWGRHWLDVAGYADSEGYTDEDPERPYAYKYRDYVISALNKDKPFDQFLREQLAGDEMVSQPFNDLNTDDREKLIATGFLRMAPDGTGAGGVDQSSARNDVLAKTIEIVSTSVLGLTVACAQCHNHRYDPISQQDYYSWRAIFEPALDPKAWLPPQKHRISLYTEADRKKAAEVEEKAKKKLQERTEKEQQFIAATVEKELAKLPEEIRGEIVDAKEIEEKKQTPEQKKLLKRYPSVNVTASSLYLYDKKAADALKKMSEQAATIRKQKPVEEFVRAVWEPAKKSAPTTFVFYRGDHEQPKQQVAPQELTVLAAAAERAIPANDETVATTGRRLAYARKLTSGSHPLVSRVLVNRIWLNHFGRGLVATPGDFGVLGARPTHPELLDFLASDLTENGWSLKRLHRLILTSAVYRQSSARHADGEKIDSENRWYWRTSLKRLDAETLRDTLLAVSGELSLRAFGPAVPVMANRVGQFVIGKENLDAGRPGKVIDMKGAQYRRSIFVQSRRSRPLSSIADFDLPRMEPNCTIRNSSTVSPQSLLLMNSESVQVRSMQFAKRIVTESGNDSAKQVRRAWSVAFSNSISEEELVEAVAFVKAQAELLRQRKWSDKEKKTAPSAELEALANLCQALISSNRFLYVE